jgi:predicted outer membrane repeat protein
MSKAMVYPPEGDHVQAVALDNISTTTSSWKRKWILLGFLVVAAIVLQSVVVISCKPSVSIPLEQTRDEEENPNTKGNRYRLHVMQQKETGESYERELKSSKARSRARGSKKASSPSKSGSKSSMKAHPPGGKKSTKAARVGKKSKKTASTDACMSLAEDTVDALEEAILKSYGQEINLCSTTIIFDREIAVEQPNAQEQQVRKTKSIIRLVCAGECIFNGNDATRLFRFGKATFPDRSPVYFDLVFKGFTFQNGYGGEGSSGLESGGAIQMIGHGRALFENCTFLRNQAPSANGGAILIETSTINAAAPTTLDLVDCTFLENYAYNGGGISAIDVSISLERTLFQENTCVGGSEGGAIFLGTNDFPYPDHVVVECIGEENVFVGNIDTDIVGPWEGCDLVVV